MKTKKRTIIRSDYSEKVFFLSKRAKSVFVQFSAFILLTFISPFFITAQIPDLQSANDFIIFTSLGALGNTGTSDISGNIGTNNGDISGFGAPTLVNGTIEYVNDVTAKCATDVQSAYDELSQFTPTVINHPLAFGNGEVILPGIYLINGAGSVAGNLVLDAEGDDDAVFIFQFKGAFSTAASSSVDLINGASPCNIFWIAEGAIAMGAISDMKGSLIANNGAISMGAGGSLEGRMLSTAGAASVDEVFAKLPICSILPVILLSFTAQCHGKNIVLKWKTAAELNSSHFTIEKSLDGESWQIIGSVPGAGNSILQIDYALTDLAQNTETAYYRLKQTDINGNYSYKATIGADVCNRIVVNKFIISPNPSIGKFELLSNGNISDVSFIDIWNAKGVKISHSIGFQSVFDLSNNAPGFYVMVIQKKSGLTKLKFILANSFIN